MLQKEHRLRHDKDIKALFQKAKSVFDVYCGLKYKKNNLNVSRFAVVVGVKVSKKAVTRNRLRRQIISTIYKHLDEIKPGYDVIILVRKEAVGKKTEELAEHILSALKKAGLF
ncbi:ribonuclease P protein component [Patescibacteria group bacterium]